MRVLQLILVLLSGIFWQATAAVTPDKQEGQYLYRVDLLRATPGRLEELMNEIKTFQKGVTHWPYMMRHSQGDQWDLMLLWPLENYQNLHAEGLYTKLNHLYQGVEGMLSFQQATYMYGPQQTQLEKRYQNNKLYHIEMFVALPDKKQQLLEERRMESQYLINIEREPNLLFVKDQGANWDAMTIGFYPSLKVFSTMADVPFAEDDKAAKDAGFEGVGKIGFYLRSLLQSHNDTLAVKP
jgi:hypothetical protein